MQDICAGYFFDLRYEHKTAEKTVDTDTVSSFIMKCMRMPMQSLQNITTRENKKEG